MTTDVLATTGLSPTPEANPPVERYGLRELADRLITDGDLVDVNYAGGNIGHFLRPGKEPGTYSVVREHGLAEIGGLIKTAQKNRLPITAERVTVRDSDGSAVQSIDLTHQEKGRDGGRLDNTISMYHPLFTTQTSYAGPQKIPAAWQVHATVGSTYHDEHRAIVVAEFDENDKPCGGEIRADRQPSLLTPIVRLWINTDGHINNISAALRDPELGGLTGREILDLLGLDTATAQATTGFDPDRTATGQVMSLDRFPANRVTDRINTQGNLTAFSAVLAQLERHLELPPGTLSNKGINLPQTALALSNGEVTTITTPQGPMIFPKVVANT